VYWGKGYITEAASMVLDFGFRKLLLHRIEAGVAIDNVASIKVLEKIGMHNEGIRRKILPIRGEWKDNFHYALLEEDFFAF
jgi:ribosomal-protein-alanine N-acetyltransferase